MAQGRTFKHLDWPRHKPRTADEDRKASQFHQQSGSYNSAVSMDTALKRLDYQISALDKKYMVPYILTTGGLGRNNRPLVRVKDPGAAVYFKMFGSEVVLACDIWDRAPCNIVALAKHIESLRGQERWGVATTKEAFAGHMALPAPMTGSEPWYSVLNIVDIEIVSKEDIKIRFKAMAKQHHSDKGGSDERMAQLLRARDEGFRYVEQR